MFDSLPHVKEFVQENGVYITVGAIILFLLSLAFSIYQDHQMSNDEEWLAKVTEEQTELMARVMTAETKRPHEMLAVGWVIRNRMEADRFPVSVSEVLHDPNAFAPVEFNDLPPEPAEGAKAIAREVLLSQATHDPTSGATHFYSPRSMEPRGSVPEWARGEQAIEMPEIPSDRFRFFRITP